MARDPFAPVVESSIPKWVWLLVGGFAVLLVGLGTTVALVLTKRPAVQAAKAGTLPPTTPEATTPEKPAEVAANDKPAATDGDKDKGDKGDEPHKKKHKPSGGSSSKKPAADSKPADSKPAEKPKPKKVMDQKDIDKLLGL
jgi:hypothetical protein